jgi:spermidine synthase
MLRLDPRRAFLPAVFVLFTASGFSGLIYESIWSHYLKLFLGHAAYAQTLVLAIFMGGMAIGAWLASRWSARWRNLLLAYALVEMLVGVASLAFHDVFVAAQAFAVDHAFPALGAGAAVHAFKWTLAAALILPQSILLGMTFPLMAGGVLRARPARPGYVIGMLYFTNSLGAAAGVLASGFYLIGAIGLPGALVTAAILNLMVAGAVVLLPRAPLGGEAPAPANAGGVEASRLLLAVALLTGLSSFMYEIGWIRMLSLVLGASTHAFELMLSAFILGLALGGFWIRRAIDRAGDTVRLLALVQLAMGVAALATLPTYDATFEVMRWAMGALQRNGDGYAAFNVLSHGIALAVMLPAAICAGMTLPLITASLLRAGAGERAIGQVYAANTVGAIAGVALAVHVGLPLLGLKGLIIAGAAIDLALGAVLLVGARGPRDRALAAAAGALGLALVLGAALLIELDAHKMASGVYRHGGLASSTTQEVLQQEDGKTATITVTRVPLATILRTNGKPDGSVTRGEALGSADMATQILLGALPLYYAPEARRIATIGFGTGVTSHVLLAGEHLQTLDSVEIEPAVVRAAPHFLPYNRRALSDPRGQIHYEDAKTFFATHPQRYDVIVSEPSNPWVSGTASLFSDEFYRDVRRHVREGGLLVQWIQAYEISPVLLASVMEAMRPHFSDYDIWAPNEGDLVVVAVNGGKLPRPAAAALKNPRLAEELAIVGIRGQAELDLHRLGGRGVFGPYFGAFGAPANSDYQPFLDFNAVKARFTRQDASELFRLLEFSIPLVRLLERGAAEVPSAVALEGLRSERNRTLLLRQALALEHYVTAGGAEALAALPAVMLSDAVALRRAAQTCRFDLPDRALRLALLDAATLVNGHLPPARAAAFWKPLSRPACVAALPVAERRWLQLHTAVAAGAPGPIGDAAQAILEAEPGLAVRFRAHALAAFMVGRILDGRSAEALRSYGENRNRLSEAREWQPAFRLLLGYADRGG